MAYSAPQIVLIRARLRAYYKIKRAAAVYEFGWIDVAEILYSYTKVRMRPERLRQFAEGQLSKGKRSGTREENIEAIVSLLMHPDINALSPGDLEEPELPHQFAYQLMEFLRHDEFSDLALPPPTLEGSYRAVVRSGEEISDLRLEIIISRDGHFVHLVQTVDIFTDPGVKDPEEWSPGERKRYFDRNNKSRGWGILTPEDNLLGFMKRRFAETYRGNHYYSTIASIPEFNAGAPIEHIALFAYDFPYGQEDEKEDRGEWFTDICNNVVSNNLRHFIRISADYPSIMGS